MKWLADHLGGGPKPAKSVEEAAKAAGISLKTLRNAREGLSVQCTRSAVTRAWVWRLPPGRAESAVPPDDQTPKPEAGVESP